MNGNDTNRRDIKETGLSLEESQEYCENTEDWRRRVAQCVFNTGCTTYQGAHADVVDGIIYACQNSAPKIENSACNLQILRTIFVNSEHFSR